MFKVMVATFTISLLTLLCVGEAFSSDMKVVSTIEHSYGMTKEDLTMDLLSSVEEWSRENFLENSRQSFMRQGFAKDDFGGSVKSTSHYVILSGKKLGVIEMAGYLKGTNEAVIRAVRVFGLVKDGMATVGCLQQSSENIPVMSGPCGDKIKDVFSLK